ncbi:MAG TPA: hypothetical protein VM754_00095 [Actinomycetota bacterium]|nr:hypothetical protein [Actinomycetota bacterium]
MINWAPSAVTDCAGSEAQIRVNGEPSSDPIEVADQSRVEVDIPEDVSGDIPVSLVSLGPDGRVLASSQFTVEGDAEDDNGVSAWLVVAAGLVATMMALAAQRMYSRRRALYGRK